MGENKVFESLHPKILIILYSDLSNNRKIRKMVQNVVLWF